MSDRTGHHLSGGTIIGDEPLNDEIKIDKEGLKEPEEELPLEYPTLKSRLPTSNIPSTTTTHLSEIEKLLVENEELGRRIDDTVNLFEICGLTSYEFIDRHNRLISKNLNLEELTAKNRENFMKKDKIMQEQAHL
ncbi:hypothetical protein QVD17_30462 [Tagetes erecta]|uniref:Uncharacterized protein n=1 Tax=Tagetes erecta TaxID=13708 RepID=A0AAD8K1X6_TARER|nr:hypothetical protein QVD17_30462 [Tagetes erecta]